MPASDKRLISLERWLRQNTPPERLDKLFADFDSNVNADWRSWYIYAGHVPARRIKRTHVLHVTAIEEGVLHCTCFPAHQLLQARKAAELEGVA